jgi:hypothetical protein
VQRRAALAQGAEVAAHLVVGEEVAEDERRAGAVKAARARPPSSDRSPARAGASDASRRAIAA